MQSTLQPNFTVLALAARPEPKPIPALRSSPVGVRWCHHNSERREKYRSTIPSQFSVHFSVKRSGEDGGQDRQSARRRHGLLGFTNYPSLRLHWPAVAVSPHLLVLAHGCEFVCLAWYRGKSYSICATIAMRSKCTIADVGIASSRNSARKAAGP